MKKIQKILVAILIILAGLTTVALSIMRVSGKHRSDPADIVFYETNNPFITGRTVLFISVYDTSAGKKMQSLPGRKNTPASRILVSLRTFLERGQPS